MTYDQAVAYLKALYFLDYDELDVLALMDQLPIYIGPDDADDVPLEEWFADYDAKGGWRA